jgi:hypothetical protein
MSKGERKSIAGRVVIMATSIMSLLGVLTATVFIMYGVSSGKVKTEYIEKSQAADHYEKRLEDTQIILKAQRDSTTAFKRRSLLDHRIKDSLNKLTEKQNERIKILERRNKSLADSLLKRRYQRGTLPD